VLTQSEKKENIPAASGVHETNISPITLPQAARVFLNSLTPEQRAKAAFNIPDDERLNWHFILRERKGLNLSDMTSPQKRFAQALLSAGLSRHGYTKALSIMSLEDLLRTINNDSRHNPENYYFSIFGEPSDASVWGFRIEGHHLSQNFTIVKGQVMDAPSFFGALPAEVKDGPRKGLRALAAEEDLARDLLKTLDDTQRKVAVVSTTAYKDILTGADRKAALNGQPSGLHASKLNAQQFDKLVALVSEYANNMPEEMARARMELLKKAGKNLYFAWAGMAEPGEPHYYRVQSPTFLIEYDNTQNYANHVHSVWRDFNNDFGLDLLKLHYQTSHE
jgi:hypothetical protein